MAFAPQNAHLSSRRVRDSGWSLLSTACALLAHLVRDYICLDKGGTSSASIPVEIMKPRVTRAQGGPSAEAQENNGCTLERPQPGSISGVTPDGTVRLTDHLGSSVCPPRSALAR
jgi:hypothetical protein